MVQPPQFTTQHHPNSLRHLPAHSNWEIVIDETGMEFEQTEDLSINDHSLGRYVALAIPQGRAKLDKLPETFHAAEEKPELLDKVINNILSQPVGVLGITAKDPLSFNRPRWFSGVFRKGRPNSTGCPKHSMPPKKSPSCWTKSSTTSSRSR